MCVSVNIETGWSKLNRGRSSRLFEKRQIAMTSIWDLVVSTGMHNVHPARIEKSSQLDCVYCLRWFNRMPACFRMESLVSSRAFFKNSFFDICTIYNYISGKQRFVTKYSFLNFDFEKIFFFGIYIENNKALKFININVLFKTFMYYLKHFFSFTKIIAKNILY